MEEMEKLIEKLREEERIMNERREREIERRKRVIAELKSEKEKKDEEKLREKIRRKERMEKHRKIQEHWETLRWITNYIEEHQEVWEIERMEREEEMRIEKEAFEKAGRFQKIEILREKDKKKREESGEKISTTPKSDQKRKGWKWETWRTSSEREILDETKWPREVMNFSFTEYKQDSHHHHHHHPDRSELFEPPGRASPVRPGGSPEDLSGPHHHHQHHNHQEGPEMRLSELEWKYLQYLEDKYQWELVQNEKNGDCSRLVESVDSEVGIVDDFGLDGQKLDGPSLLVIRSDIVPKNTPKNPTKKSQKMDIRKFLVIKPSSKKNSQNLQQETEVIPKEMKPNLKNEKKVKKIGGATKKKIGPTLNKKVEDQDKVEKKMKKSAKNTILKFERNFEIFEKMKVSAKDRTTLKNSPRIDTENSLHHYPNHDPSGGVEGRRPKRKREEEGETDEVNVHKEIKLDDKEGVKGEEKKEIGIRRNEISTEVKKGSVKVGGGSPPNEDDVISGQTPN